MSKTYTHSPVLDIPVAFDVVEYDREKELLITRIMTAMKNWQSIQPKDVSSNDPILRYIGTEKALFFSWFRPNTPEATEYIDNFFSNKKYLRDPCDAFTKLFTRDKLEILSEKYLRKILSTCFSWKQDAYVFSTSRRYRQIRREMKVFERIQKRRMYYFEKKRAELHPVPMKKVTPKIGADNRSWLASKRVNTIVIDSCSMFPQAPRREQAVKRIFQCLKNWRANNVESIDFNVDSSDVTALLVYMDTKRSRQAIEDGKTTRGEQKEYIRNFFKDSGYKLLPVYSLKCLLNIETLKALPVSYLDTIAQRITRLQFENANVFKATSCINQITNEVNYILRQQRVSERRLLDLIRS